MSCRRPAPLRCKKALVWIALIAVLMHGFLPLAHAVPSVRGYMMPMCSAGGTAVELFVALDTEDRGSESALATINCPLCIAGAHIALPGPKGGVSFTPTDLAHVLLAGLPPADLSARSQRYFSARAPPRS